MTWPVTCLPKNCCAWPPECELDRRHPLAVHGRAARHLLERWGYADQAVLDAVEDHTTGPRDPDALLSVCVYIADVSEPGRGVNDDIRELAFHSLSEAYRAAVVSKVTYLQGRGTEVHPRTLQAFYSLTAPVQLRLRSPREGWASSGPAWLASLWAQPKRAVFGGLWAMSTPGTADAAAFGSTPRLTLLLAGRDVAYCGYHLRCEDQSQRENLFQPINTDTLMLIKVNGTQVDVLNIPRDTNVGPFDPEKSLAEQKVNSQYQLGGPEALTQAVEQITGDHIDAYAVVGSEYVGELIDALGGLDVTVPEGGLQWQDKAAGIDLNLPPGPQHLDGETAVLYLRVRKGFGDDWGRIDHQKQALTQLLGKLRSPQGLALLPTLMSGFGTGLETNLDPTALAGLVPLVPELTPRFATLPTQPIEGNYNLAPDREALLKVWSVPQEVQDRWQEEELAARLEAGEMESGEIAAGTLEAGVQEGQAPADPASEADLLGVPVRVVDAGKTGLGPALLRVLRQLGYQNLSLDLPGPVASPDLALPATTGAVSQQASSESSQVLTLDALATANALSRTLRLPRLQGERFPIQQGEVVVVLGRDAASQFAGLTPLALPQDQALYSASAGPYVLGEDGQLRTAEEARAAELGPLPEAEQ
ncbi:LCP family protein [Deinococcus lacus]|uniref:LCP family protein n=1 Tax=Deinococcus lacus TaxID=392561 RepID=A0ABW1YCR9_9DEIO